MVSARCPWEVSCQSSSCQPVVGTRHGSIIGPHREWRQMKSVGMTRVCIGPSEEIDSCSNTICSDMYREIVTLPGRPVTLMCEPGGAEQVAWYRLDMPVDEPGFTLAHTEQASQLTLIADAHTHAPVEGVYSCRRMHGPAIITYGVSFEDPKDGWWQIFTRFKVVITGAVVITVLAFISFVSCVTLRGVIICATLRGTNSCWTSRFIWWNTLSAWLHCKKAMREVVFDSLLKQLNTHEARRLLGREEAALLTETLLCVHVVRDLPLPPIPAKRAGPVPGSTCVDTATDHGTSSEHTFRPPLGNTESREMAQSEEILEVATSEANHSNIIQQVEDPCETARNKNTQSKASHCKILTGDKPPYESAQTKKIPSEIPRRKKIDNEKYFKKMARSRKSLGGKMPHDISQSRNTSCDTVWRNKTTLRETAADESSANKKPTYEMTKRNSDKIVISETPAPGVRNSQLSIASSSQTSLKVHVGSTQTSTRWAQETTDKQTVQPDSKLCQM